MSRGSLVETIHVHGCGRNPVGIARFAWTRGRECKRVFRGKDWTNNEAVYRAVRSAVNALPPRSCVDIYCSVATVVQQLCGTCKVDKPHLKMFVLAINRIIEDKHLVVGWRWVRQISNTKRPYYFAEPIVE